MPSTLVTAVVAQAINSLTAKRSRSGEMVIRPVARGAALKIITIPNISRFTVRCQFDRARQACAYDSSVAGYAAVPEIFVEADRLPGLGTRSRATSAPPSARSVSRYRRTLSIISAKTCLSNP
jgi:hypothetical protein